MVAPGWVRGCSRGMGGMRGCSGGGCVVAWGACMVAPGGHAWFLVGGMHVFFGGACMVFSGGCAWFFSGETCVVFSGGGMRRIRRDTVNERAVRILLECILVLVVRSRCPKWHCFHVAKECDANRFSSSIVVGVCDSVLRFLFTHRTF